MGWKERDPAIKNFYQSKIWRQVRQLYVKQAFGICEACGNKGEIVHHRIPITTHNLHDQRITIDFANLELLCRICHRICHSNLNCTQNGLVFDEAGDLIEAKPPGGRAEGGNQKEPRSPPLVNIWVARVGGCGLRYE